MTIELEEEIYACILRVPTALGSKSTVFESETIRKFRMIVDLLRNQQKKIDALKKEVAELKAK